MIKRKKWRRLRLHGCKLNMEKDSHQSAQTFGEEGMRFTAALFCCVSIESTMGMKERFSSERSFHTQTEMSLFFSLIDRPQRESMSY